MLAPVPWQDPTTLAARVRELRREAAAARRTRPEATPEPQTQGEARPRTVRGAKRLGGAHG